MYSQKQLKRLLLSAIILCSQESWPNPIPDQTTFPSKHSSEPNIPQCYDKQTKLLEEIAEGQKQQSQLLALQLMLAKQKIELQMAEEANRQAIIEAQKKDAEKGFSLTDCGIVFYDTFFEQFNLRAFSLELTKLLVVNLRQMLMKKALNEILGIPDIVLGDLPARYGYNNAAVYPMQFLGSNSFSQYKVTRKNLIEELDPRVQELKKTDATRLAQANTTTTLLDALAHSERLKNRIEQEAPEVKNLNAETDKILKDNHINPAQLQAEERLDKAKDLVVQARKKEDIAVIREFKRRNHEASMVKELEELNKDSKDFNPLYLSLLLDQAKIDLEIIAQSVR